MSAYRKDFGETKCVSFLIKDDKLSEKYNTIQEKAENSLKKEFDSKPVHNKQIFHAFLSNIRNYSPR